MCLIHVDTLTLSVFRRLLTLICVSDFAVLGPQICRIGLEN